MKTDTLSQSGGTHSLWRLLLVLLISLLYLMTGQAMAGPLSITVVSVDKTGVQTPITNYRWTVEEDLSKASVPGQHATRDNYSFSFHSSYMPVLAAGKVVGGTALVGNDCTAANSVACLDPDRKYMALPDLDTSKRYYVSVLPDDGNAMGGAPVVFNAGTGTATVYVNKYPVPTAQISVFVFEDNSPLNAAPDLPQEQGLAGFTIFLTEAGGTYGGSGGQVTQDAFGNPLGTTYQYDGSGQAILDPDGSPTVVMRGTGIILSGADGVATIKNLFPAKYTIQVIPPAGADWHQTTTIEGTKGDDAWVKNGEPSFFQEFGPPGHHVFTGFTHSGFIARNGTTPVLNGSTSITGRVVNIHNSRPPNYTFYPTAGVTNPVVSLIPKCWVALNEAGGGRALYASPCNADSTFAIPSVPPGTYELAVWDEALDVIIASAPVTVATGESTHAMGDVPVFNWFAKYEGRVFYDANGNGFPDPGEVGIAGQVQNIRFRDGSIYQSTLTKNDGTFSFNEFFPFFNWMIAEVDYARFKATGATITVDAGGPVPAHNGWTMPSFNKLNPQVQPDNLPYRVEQGVVLLEGMQSFLGQTNHIEFGKKAYSGQENGGIAGIVQYGITRAEDDPKNGTAETWEPGIPRVQVNLFLDCDGDGKPDKPNVAGDGTCAAGGLSGANSYAYDPPDVDNYPFCWRDPESCGLTTATAQMGPEDKKLSATGGAAFSYGDVVTWGNNPDTNAPYIGLGKTDGWDDALPSGCPAGASGPYAIPYGTDAGTQLDCYDGLRAWNQVRPAVFDGGYAFGSVAGQDNLPNVKYIVQAVAPAGYFHQGNGDKNVVFGDTVTPAPLAEPYACVGMSLPVPQYLTLFPDAQEPNILYTGVGQTWKKCDMKLVDMQPGRNPAPNFFLYTEAPVAGHGVGFILDDLSSEFDVNAPTFGEKHAPPHLPVSIRDWTGREISRVYADEFGSYNFLVPSTFTINPPFPSGVGPSMMVACMNSPGPIDRDPVTGAHLSQPIIDPYFNRQYSQFCYTLQYLPGKTTYLDTPVVPVAAFAGRTQNPLDCDLSDGTPMIYSVTNNANTGPWVSGGGQALTIVSGGSVDVLNPYYNPAESGSTKTIKRDYGFGGTKGSVSIGGTAIAAANITTWNNDMIVVTVPNGTQTGQLAVTRGDNDVASTVGVTVTVGGTAPIAVPPGGSIQAVIDAPTTSDGALITVPPGIYNEYVIMDKKIRLQGWGALSVTINAAKFSTDGLKNWRTLINRKIDATPANPPVIDADTGLNTIIPGSNRTFDLLPGQILGHSISNNEPLFFGAEEGPGILVVAKSSANGSGNGHFNNSPNARIDGLTITGADYGGGILASGYARYLQISNNRVLSNYGTYGGGIRIGHTALLDETNTAYGGYTDSVNPDVKIFNNWIAENGSTEAGAGGGISIGNGTSRYQVTSNQMCGNFSMGDGGGIGHLGLSDGGSIANNKIVFNQTINQSANPTGGGISIDGEASLDASGLSPGTGSVTITQNLIQGNSASAGAGGGVRLSAVNGLDVSRSPNNTNNWNKVTLVNNIIVDNVAAYAGGGVSLLDALQVNASNNTIANNDSTATNQESFTGPGTNASNAQPAGLVSHATSSGLLNAMNPGRRNDNRFSNPTLHNNIVWHNRSFCWAVTGPNPGEFGLFDPNTDGTCTGKTSSTPTAGTNPVYIDLAVLGTGTGTFANRYVGGAAPAKLTPDHSILTSLTGYDSTNLTGDPLFVSSYFNGNAKPAPTIPGFSTTIDTAATSDEGGNFIDIRYGPLTQWNCLDSGGAVKSPQNAANCPLFGDYHIKTGSPAINAGLSRTGSNGVPTVDFDNDARPVNAIDIGADELGNGAPPPPPPTTLPPLALLDNFNRANANTLGANWSQTVLFGQASIRVNTNQALDSLITGWAVWNGTGNVFGARQGAAFTFAGTTLNNSWLILKGSGGSATTPANYIRVNYAGTQVDVATTITAGLSFVTRATFPASFASGDTLSATAYADGTVSVFKTSGATTTSVGNITIPTSGTGAWTQGTGGGRIGMLLPANVRVDNFSGGTVP